LRKRDVHIGADDVEFGEGGASVHEGAAVRAEGTEVSRCGCDRQIVRLSAAGFLGDIEDEYASEIAARPVEAGDEAGRNRVEADLKNDRN
jgi:hypothetical protein